MRSTSTVATLAAVLLFGSTLSAWAVCGTVTNARNVASADAGKCIGAGQCGQVNPVPGSCPSHPTNGCETFNNPDWEYITYNGTNCTGSGQGTCTYNSRQGDITDARTGICSG